MSNLDDYLPPESHDRDLTSYLQPASAPPEPSIHQIHFWDLIQLVCEEAFQAQTRMDNLETVPPNQALDMMESFLDSLFSPNPLAMQTFDGRDIPTEVDKLVVEFQLPDRAALRRWMWDRLMPIAYRVLWLRGFRTRWYG